MTAQEFNRYLEQPRLLYKLPLPDLQELALRFPYSSNIRQLLLLKAHLEGHPEEEAYLNRCAAASFDRAHLRDVLRELDAEQQTQQATQAETLELRQLDELDLEPVLLQGQDEDAARGTDTTPYFIEQELPAAEDEEEALFSRIDTEEEDHLYEDLPSGINLPTEEPTLPNPVTDEPTEPEQSAEITAPEPAGPAQTEPVVTTPEPPTVAEPEEHVAAVHQLPTSEEQPPEPDADTADETTPNQPVSSPQPAPRRPAGALSERLARIRRLQEDRSRNQAKEDVNRIARRSLVAHEQVASETLADLLVRQGQYQNAIRMYQRLILLYPDKKPIFAGLIQDLEQKL